MRHDTLHCILCGPDPSRKDRSGYFIHDQVICECLVSKKEREHVDSICKLTFARSRSPLANVLEDRLSDSLAVSCECSVVACEVLDAGQGSESLIPLALPLEWRMVEDGVVELTGSLC